MSLLSSILSRVIENPKFKFKLVYYRKKNMNRLFYLSDWYVMVVTQVLEEEDIQIKMMRCELVIPQLPHNCFHQPLFPRIHWKTVNKPPPPKFSLWSWPFLVLSLYFPTRKSGEQQVLMTGHREWALHRHRAIQQNRCSHFHSDSFRICQIKKISGPMASQSTIANFYL